MANVLRSFSYSSAVNPLYFIPRERIQPGKPLRDPTAHWSRVAESRLDGALASLDRNDPMRVRARDALGMHRSFGSKCRAFFKTVRPDLNFLEKHGVSPNFVGACMVFVAWDWSVQAENPIHRLLTRSPTSWQKHWKILETLPSALIELVPISRACIAYGRRAEELRESGRSPDLQKVMEDKLDALLRRHWKAPKIDPSLPTKLAELGEALQSLRPLLAPLQKAVPIALKINRRGRPAEDKTNDLIMMLGTVFHFHTGHPRAERIARILNAARLADISPHYFDAPKVKERYKRITRTRYGRDACGYIKAQITHSLEVIRRTTP